MVIQKKVASLQCHRNKTKIKTPFMKKYIDYREKYGITEELSDVLNTDVTDTSIDQREAIKNFISEMIFGFELYETFDMSRDIATYIYTGDAEDTEMFGGIQASYLNEYRILCLQVCELLGLSHEELKAELIAEFGSRKSYVI